MRDLLNLFGEYLAECGSFEIIKTRLQGYVALGYGSEKVVYLRNFNEIAEYILTEMLFDALFCGKFPQEEANEDFSPRVIEEFTRRTLPYITEMPVLTPIMHKVIEDNRN